MVVMVVMADMVDVDMVEIDSMVVDDVVVDVVGFDVVVIDVVEVVDEDYLMNDLVRFGTYHQLDFDHRS